VRAGGTSAVDICSVACGRLDAYYEIGIHPWDIAAGKIQSILCRNVLGDSFAILYATFRMINGYKVDVDLQYNLKFFPSQYCKRISNRSPIIAMSIISFETY
jgi:hypothetical protein